MECQKIEIYCPKCENDKIEHKATVLEQEETRNKEIIRFQCDDCRSIGTFTVYRMSGMEIIDCP
ncbi:MAG: hypothetical protein R6U44_10500 [Archaeoglobaceae archaeon]